MKFDPAADVAIVIPVHNRRAKTMRCIDSLRALEDAEVSLIVVDDGSSDGTSDFLASQDDLVVLRGTGDLWWSRSVDLGCRQASSAGARVIVLLNDDNVVAPNLVSTLVETVDRTNGCVAAVVLESYVGDKGTIYQAGGTLNWHRRGIGLRKTGAEYVQDERVEDCDWLPGCALAFPTEAFLELGGFEPRFPQYRGDIDFTTRARRRGYRCSVTFQTWVLNDLTDSPLTFRARVGLAEFLRGFVTLRSNYNVRETVLFAWRHCPKRLILFYLAQFYARYAWAALKTQRFAFIAALRALRAAM